jgi:hypothetical protein
VDEAMAGSVFDRADDSSPMIMRELVVCKQLGVFPDIIKTSEFRQGERLAFPENDCTNGD